MSRASFCLLPSINIAVFQLDFTTPSWVQPEVPEEMPKVWLPEVPLVVAPSTWGAMPLWPSISLLPQPQLPILLLAAIAPTGIIPRKATTMSRLFNIKIPPEIE